MAFTAPGGPVAAEEETLQAAVEVSTDEDSSCRRRPRTREDGEPEE